MTRLGFEKLALLANEILEDTNLSKACDTIFDNFQDVIPFDRIGVGIFNPQSQEVTLKWARSKDNAALEPAVNYKIKITPSLWRILETSVPRIINDLELYLQENPQSVGTQKIVSSGFKSSLTCPVRNKEGCVGFIFFSSHEKNTYKNEHVKTYQLIASQIGLLLEIVKLDESLTDLKMKESFFNKCLHDMGNSLNIVSCYSKLILKRNHQEFSEKTLQTLQSMDKQMDNAIHLFEDLQNYGEVISSNFSVKKSTVYLKSFFNQFYMASQFLCAKKKIEMQIIEDPELPKYFTFDPKRIIQVLNNFVSNAIKFSMPGTKITLELQTLPDRSLLVSLRDEGQGIAPADREKIFLETQHFKTMPTHNEACKGLGLAICKRIIEDHQGKIWFESTYGKGSVFSFSIPLASVERNEVSECLVH